MSWLLWCALVIVVILAFRVCWLLLTMRWPDSRTERDHFQEARGQIRKMIDGTGGTYEWDDHMHMFPGIDGRTRGLITIANSVSDLFPAEAKSGFCSAEGIRFLEQLLDATADQAGATSGETK